jgi:hypothetical protein
MDTTSHTVPGEVLRFGLARLKVWSCEVVCSKTNQKGALEGSKRQRRLIEVSGVPLSAFSEKKVQGHVGKTPPICVSRPKGLPMTPMDEG